MPVSLITFLYHSRVYLKSLDCIEYIGFMPNYQDSVALDNFKRKNGVIDKTVTMSNSQLVTH